MQKNNKNRTYAHCGLLTVCVWTMLVTQSCPTLCDPTNCSPPGFSVHGILQARILEWIAIPFSRGTSKPRDRTLFSCLKGRFFTVWATGEVSGGLLHIFLYIYVYTCICVYASIWVWHLLVAQSCPTLCNPMDSSPPGSSVHEILQAGILRCVVISFSRGSSWPINQTWVSALQTDSWSEPPGKPNICMCVYILYSLLDIHISDVYMSSLLLIQLSFIPDLIF